MPGARKSKFSKDKQAARHRFGSRPQWTRAPLPVIVVVCDDTRTAPAYFAALARELKQKVTIDVVGAPHQGAKPDAVVELAREKRQELAEFGPRDAVWALVDTEGCEQQERQARRLQNQESARTRGRGVDIAISIPCFEMWTLLHLQDTGQLFANSQAVLDELRLAWKKKFAEELGHKAQADYSKILPFRQTAAERATKRWNHNDLSRTELFKVMASIDDAAPP